MRFIVIALATIFVALQLRLFVGDGGLMELRRLSQEIDRQEKTNARLEERNAALEGEVRDLKSGMEALEERARSELGMVKKDEQFFQWIEPRPDADR